MPSLKINHPLPGDTVVSNFVLAQGDGDPAITNLIGIIWDSLGGVVAVGMAIAPPPHWAIAFTNFAPGKNYRLEVIDANTLKRLGCSSPFDAVHKAAAHGPAIYYPVGGPTVSRNMSSYGYTPGVNPVEGRVVEPTVPNPAWVAQSQGPAATPYWVVTLSNLALDATHGSTLTVRDSVNIGSSTDSPHLAIQ